MLNIKNFPGKQTVAPVKISLVNLAEIAGKQNKVNMNKRTKIVSLSLSLITLFGTLYVDGVEQTTPPPSQPTQNVQSALPKEQTPEEKLKALDAEIMKLSQEIQKKRTEALNTQVEAQSLLQTHWEGYIEKMVEADRQTDAAKALEKKMHELQAKRKELAEKQYRR